jgi:hypothetical protein
MLFGGKNIKKRKILDKIRRKGEEKDKKEKEKVKKDGKGLNKCKIGKN